MLTLPGKHWKWRMHGAAITMAEMVNQWNGDYDLILASDMIDLSVFKCLLKSQKPIYLYFHENQLTYPWSKTDPDPQLKRDHHYGWINYTSCLVADKVIFNSNYNRSSFFSAIEDLVKRMPDFNHIDLESLKNKSSVLPIGIEIDGEINKSKRNPPTILWNHRWEYDKNPELFFNSLFKLDEEEIDFKLIVCGENYDQSPPIFEEARNLLKSKMIHFGYARDESSYKDLLTLADIYPVTSNQDFFGISVLEAIAAGAEPLLPYKLAYPEHFPDPKFDYIFYKKETEYYPLLKKLILNKTKETLPCQYIRSKYPWNKVIKLYDQFFEQILDSKS